MAVEAAVRRGCFVRRAMATRGRPLGLFDALITNPSSELSESYILVEKQELM